MKTENNSLIALLTADSLICSLKKSLNGKKMHNKTKRDAWNHKWMRLKMKGTWGIMKMREALLLMNPFPFYWPHHNSSRRLNICRETTKFMYRVNSWGPNIDPCGTPLSTIWGLDLKASATTVWALPERYYLKYLMNQNDYITTLYSH